MAIDTVGLQSSYISLEAAESLKSGLNCISKIGIRNFSGDIYYDITQNELEGSFDHRLLFRIETEEFIAQEKGPPRRVPSAPYIRLEGSFHKFMLGHNVFGGTDDFQAACDWFLSHLVAEFDVDLIGVDWFVYRIDWAECYQLATFEACQDYLRGLNASDFPRRKVVRYGNESLFVPGHTTSIKIYHKGPEFAKHDSRRLNRHLSSDELKFLQARANTLIRSEVEIKRDKFKYLFDGSLPAITDITLELLHSIYDLEMFKLLREAKIDMDTVRTAREVQHRLHEIYSQRLANILFGVWMQLSSLGEDCYKTSVSKRTFYRQRKQLIEACCDWHSTDVILRDSSLIPSGFSLRRGSEWHICGEAPQVAQLLEPFRKVA